MSEQFDFDVVVIGSGPGGEGAAMKAAKEGRTVAVVERMKKVGGSCTHSGTIPSKALRQIVGRLMEFNTTPLFREATRIAKPTFGELMATTNSVITRQANMRQQFYERNAVPVFYGHATFITPSMVAVALDGSRVQTVSARHFVIATGSRPYRPADVDFKHPRIFDSDTILGMKQTPRSMTIYGAGVIGCEYASIFRNLGVKVNLVNTRARLLEFLDDEISDALSYHLRDQGVIIRHNEKYDRLDFDEDSVLFHMQSGKTLKTDIVLFANGRSGNTDNMGLEDIDIKPNSRGQLDVNEVYQTSQPHIYAVGDVVGFPGLASAAYDQGRFAATHICTGKCDQKLIENIPNGIYTSPEISSVGKTEAQLTAEKVPYEVGHSSFKSLARAQITMQTVGMLKILFHRQTLEILGIHCFGYQASEIVHIGQAIMSQKGEGNTLLYFINTTFNYPTMAEGYRVAALNGLNRVAGI